MFEYGKMSSCAVASMSALAEAYPQKKPLSSKHIAESRKLSQPLVAKILTILAQHKLIDGTRGPGGGYRLIKAPSKITVLDVVSLFENQQGKSICPFGPGWCGIGDPCPLHDSLIEMSQKTAAALKSMNFADFVEHTKASHLQP